MRKLLSITGTMTIQKLKALIHRLYKIDEDINLSYVSQKVFLSYNSHTK